MPFSDIKDMLVYGDEKVEIECEIIEELPFEKKIKIITKKSARICTLHNYYLRVIKKTPTGTYLVEIPVWILTRLGLQP
jgi:hypothetical protein